MKIKHLLLLTLLVPFFAQAQKKKLSMQQAVVGLWTDLKVKNLSQLQFCGSSSQYAYVTKQDSSQVILQADSKTHDLKKFIDLKTLSALLVNKGEKELGRFPAIKWVNANSFYFHKSNQTYWAEKKDSTFKLSKLWELPKGANITAEDNNAPQLAFANDHNLYIRTTTGLHQITDDGSENIVYGQAVHRFEFGITNGSFWSPKSNFLAFYRKDQSMVADYPIIDWASVPAKANTIKYPMAGDKSHQVTIGIYDLKNKATQYLKIDGPKDQYLTSVSWSPDEKYIYVGVLSRSQKHLDFNKYSAETGLKIKTIFTDTHDKYVEPQHPLWFYKNTPDEFVWLSQRDGFMHMYCYKNGKQKKQLTRGNWIVNETLAYNKEQNEIIFTATKDGAMDKNIYTVSIDNSKIRKINENGGWHSPKASADGSYIIDAYTNLITPRNIDVINTNRTNEQKRLLTAKNPLANYETAKTTLVKLKVENNTELYGKLIYPSNFDTTKKYPAIVYLYNGPHAQMNRNSFPYSGNLWRDYMASKGYFVFVMDGRGSSNRGLAFENITHGRMGEVEMQDQLKGVKFLKSLSYIDSNRLGVHGWSYGGFMTTSLMTKYPKVFKCGVAGGPVMDWKMYEIMYTERYMDSPDSSSNKAGYDATRLWNKADKLENPLLIIHGTQDDVVVWQHSMKFIRDAVKKNKPIDYFVYPAHPHNVRGMDRVHLMQKITDYFDLHLQ